MDKKRLTLILITALLAVMGILYIGIKSGARQGKAPLVCDLTKELSGKSENEALPGDIVFNGQTLMADNPSNRLFYSLNKNDAASFSPKALVLSDPDAYVVMDREITQELIESGQTARLAVIKGDEYREFELAVTTLPIMTIDYTGDIEEYEVDMNMFLYDNGATTGEVKATASAGTIRYRGASTLFYPKKAFKLNLKRYEGGVLKNNPQPLLGMRDDDDWLLYAAYNDMEKVRDVFSENLWYETLADDNSWGVKAGMCYRYVEVILNGRYHGLYALGFPVDEKQLNLSGDCSKEALYKKKTWDSEDTLEVSQWGILPGYEAKTDNKYVQAGYEGEFGYYEDKKGNEVYDLSEYALLYEHYLYLARNCGDSESLLKCVDLDNLIDINIFFNLIQGEDNVEGHLFKNEFIAVKRDKENGIKILYAPWDMDISWGNKWVDDGDRNFTESHYFLPEDNFTGEFGYYEEILINSDTDLLEKTAEKYAQLRNDKWSFENIDKMLDSCEADIFGSGAFIRDKERWPEGIYTDEGNLEAFKEYVHARLEYLDGYYGRLGDDKEKSLYVRRLSKYEPLDESPILLEIADPSVLEDEDLADLLTYVGMDVNMFKNGAVCAVGSVKDGYEYFDSFVTSTGEIKTKVGNLTLRKVEGYEYFLEDEYTVFLGENEGYVRREQPTEAVVFSVCPQNRMLDVLNLHKHYDPVVKTETFTDETLKKLLNKYGY
ncbi:MAG: CotH kinase family protein [Lachnospiraceae bacterium]|nr:CotH kinase family protein [Lachnospiraceae bacterium]